MYRQTLLKASKLSLITCVETLRKNLNIADCWCRNL